MKSLSLFILCAFFCLNSKADNVHDFPPNFHWCAATAAYQIEGGNHQSDWWLWEQTKGHVSHGDRTLKACDSWHHFPRDVTALKMLHADTYRFSIEWSRIEPKEGVINKKAILHYRKEIKLLLKKGITPLITLQHFTFPRWLADKGGWEWEGTPNAFANYADLVRKKIAPEAGSFVTINEPFVNILSGYLMGLTPPGKKISVNELIKPITGLLKSHAEVARRFHAVSSNQTQSRHLEVGMAHHLRIIAPKNEWNPLDVLIANTLNPIWNWSIPDALETGEFKISILGLIDQTLKIPNLAHTQDFIGINYYTRTQFSFEDAWANLTGKGDPNAVNQQMKPENWEYYPQGLETLIKEANQKYADRPIWITENGLSSTKLGIEDGDRVQYLKDHLQSVLNAIHAGAKVRGYCYWSLMDNFEWIYGYQQHFGLFETDYELAQLKPRKSALFFKNVATRNRL